MKGKDLLIVGAAVFVLYKLAQVKPVVGQSGGQVVNIPVTGQTPSGVALLDVRGAGGGGGGLFVPYAREASYGGGDPYALERQRFLNWVDSIPVGCEGSNDPRCKPSVINVNDL